MRLFFAIPLPPSWSDSLAQQDLSAVKGTKIRPVAAANLHITQLFLGEVDDYQPLLEMFLSLKSLKSLRSLKSFTLSVDRLTANRRMVWLRFHPNDTFSLNGKLLKESAQPYAPMIGAASSIPHITLLRGNNLKLKEPLPSPLVANELEVTEYQLWQSQLSSRGAQIGRAHV